MSAGDDVDLVDRRKDDSDDERYAEGAPKMGSAPAVRERVPHQLTLRAPHGRLSWLARLLRVALQATEIEQHAGFVADGPGVVPGRHVERLSRSVLVL